MKIGENPSSHFRILCGVADDYGIEGWVQNTEGGHGGLPLLCRQSDSTTYWPALFSAAATFAYLRTVARKVLLLAGAGTLPARRDSNGMYLP